VTAIIIDTETTDNKPEEAEAMSLAFVHLDIETGLVSAPHESFYKPSKPPKFGALATHHILMEEVEGMPPSKEALAHVDSAEYWIGHNIDFDWTVLGKPQRVKRICTLALSRALWPECDSHSLSSMAYYLLGATEETRARVKSAHSALADVHLCASILQVILSLLKPHSLQDLYEESEDARIPRIMTFGKHKGKKIEEVDRGYSNWYRKQPDPDPYLLEAFKRAGI